MHMSAARSRSSTVPAAVRDLAHLLLDQIADLSEKIVGLVDTGLHRRAGTNDTARRLAAISSIAAITAATIPIFAPSMETFSKRARFRGMGWPDSEATSERR